MFDQQAVQSELGFVSRPKNSLSIVSRGAKGIGDLPKTCHLLPSIAILEPQSRYARFNCSIRYLPREGMPANVGPGLRTASGAERSLGGTKYPLSQLPNATPFEEHRQVAIFADLENRSVQRCGQAGQGSRALDRAAQLETLGGDPQDRTEGQEPAVMVDHDGTV
jgi:hypothetical protein